MKSKLLIVIAILSMFNTLNAQIVKIDFDENINDKVGIYSPEGFLMEKLMDRLILFLHLE